MAVLVLNQEYCNMGESSENPFKSEDEEVNSNGIPEEAFLILEGFKLVPLIHAVIRIGRRLENNIIIDDPRVSRFHAEIHAVDGNYELHDLDSLGGTYINGQRITKSILYSGDEISLAGFIMIYRQHDAPPRTDLRETSPFQSE